MAQWFPEMQTYWPFLFIVMVASFSLGLWFAGRVWGRRGNIEELQHTLNTQLIEQTQRLVEAVSKAREENKDAIGHGFGITQRNLAESFSRDRKEIAETLSRTQGFLADRLNSLIKESAEVKAASNRMLEIGEEIRTLNQIIQGPKGRGGFGEFQLELILSQAVPRDKYFLQHKIGEGVVDAAIQLKDRLLCIDSKFPYANLRKYYESVENSPERERALKQFYSDVRNRAREISKKYIVPSITLDFAIMFIPAEAVFMEIVSSPELHKDLMDMHVVPASPNFLYVYFQALAIGFRGMAVEEQAREIIAALSELQIGLERFQGSFKTLGSHIANAASQYEESRKQASRLSQTLENLRLGQRDQPPSDPPARSS